VDNESFVAQIHDMVMRGQAALVHPFNDKVLEGRATKADLAVLAVQVYHRGLFSARFAAANLARCPVPEVRRALLGVVNDEEAKLPGEPPSHCDMMLTFAAALGLDRDEVIHARPLPNTLVFIDTIMQLSEGHWLEGMSMRASEIVGPPLGPLWTDALQRHYGFRPADIVWWTEHGEADVGHSNIALEVYRRYVRDESEREIALRGVERMLAAWRIFYDGIQQGAIDAAAGRDVGFRVPAP